MEKLTGGHTEPHSPAWIPDPGFSISDLGNVADAAAINRR
jgi:hypothetical protein